ncbi:MAG: MoaD/ThiS family protein [Staphylothermus sp.]|nr:MoaD/ThiS family protein [Staphylothermus sp.]
MPYRVKVHVYTTLIEKMGWKQKILEFEYQPTIEEVLNKLPELKKTLKEYEQRGIPAIIMINGRRIEFLKGYKTPLQDGDEISIFPPSAGG